MRIMKGTVLFMEDSHIPFIEYENLEYHSMLQNGRGSPTFIKYAPMDIRELTQVISIPDHIPDEQAKMRIREKIIERIEYHIDNVVPLYNKIIKSLKEESEPSHITLDGILPRTHNTAG